MLRVDHFSIFFHLIVLLVALATILMSLDYLPFQKIDHGEYYALILLGAVGTCLMSSAVELVLIFIALEISSISSYILAGFRRQAAESAESSMKYFLLGSFATAFFLYGVALLYGATGSTNVFDIATALSSTTHIEPLAYVAVALIFTGLGFKVALCSLSCVDSGCVRGRTFAGCGLHVHGAQGGGFCGSHSLSHRYGFAPLVLGDLDRCRAFDVHWQSGRALCRAM